MQVTGFRRTQLRIDTPVAPPTWALLERELLRANSRACEEFFNYLFDERGYLRCIPRWGGDDGPDDAIENLADWPVLHALGGANGLLEMSELAWEGHVRQYTEAKTTDVPFARDGMYYKEFPTICDWLHNGESMSVFNLLGLSNPYAMNFEKRVRYFDPVQRRAGIPEDVAALVETMTADETVINLVNLNQTEPRSVVIQGGGYGEHQILTAQIGDMPLDVNGTWCTVRLEPGCGGRITLKMARYANAPSMLLPWD